MSPSPATITAQIGLSWDHRTGSVSIPIYQSATFRHPALGESTGYDYSRTGNPTRQALEEGFARLENGCRGFAYASGMAAITSLLFLFRRGDHLIVTEDLYGGTYRLFERIFSSYDLSVTYLDTTDLDAVQRGIRPETRGIFLETLTNPLLKVADIPALASICRQHDILLIADNTFLTPLLCRPLDLGAHISLSSGSKYLAGHNDVICGLVAVRDDALAERIAFHQNGAGGILGPQDAWLTIRGMKTLAVRLQRQEENARTIARHLAQHPRVTRVWYPGLPTHPGHETLRKIARGFGAMISFEIDDPRLISQILSRVRVISFAESLGGVESLITYPALQTHADIEPEVRERLGITQTLLRLSVGIEDPHDLIDDLDQALKG